MKPAIGDLVKYVNASEGDVIGPTGGISQVRSIYLGKEFIVTGFFEHGVFLEAGHKRISAFFWRVELVDIHLENE